MKIKLRKGIAKCIWAVNYPVDVEKMSLKMELNRLLKQAALNEDVKAIQHSNIYIWEKAENEKPSCLPLTGRRCTVVRKQVSASEVAFLIEFMPF